MDRNITASGWSSHEYDATLRFGNLITEPDDAWISGVVDEYIWPGTIEGSKDRSSRVCARSIDKVGRSKNARQLELGVEKVDCHDGIGRNQCRRLNNVEADAACPV